MKSQTKHAHSAGDNAIEFIYSKICSKMKTNNAPVDPTLFYWKRLCRIYFINLLVMLYGTFRHPISFWYCRYRSISSNRILMSWRWKNTQEIKCNKISMTKCLYKLETFFYCIWNFILHDIMFVVLLLCYYPIFLLFINCMTVNIKNMTSNNDTLTKMKEDHVSLIFDTATLTGSRLYSRLRTLYLIKDKLNALHYPLYSKEYYYHLFSSNNIPHPRTVIIKNNYNNHNCNYSKLIPRSREYGDEKCVKLIESSDSIIVKPSESYFGQRQVLWLRSKSNGINYNKYYKHHDGMSTDCINTINRKYLTAKEVALWIKNEKQMEYFGGECIVQENVCYDLQNHWSLELGTWVKHVHNGNYNECKIVWAELVGSCHRSKLNWTSHSVTFEFILNVKNGSIVGLANDHFNVRHTCEHDQTQMMDELRLIYDTKIYEKACNQAIKAHESYLKLSKSKGESIDCLRSWDVVLTSSKNPLFTEGSTFEMRGAFYWFDRFDTALKLFDLFEINIKIVVLCSVAFWFGASFGAYYLSFGLQYAKQWISISNTAIVDNYNQNCHNFSQDIFGMFMYSIVCGIWIKMKPFRLVAGKVIPIMIGEPKPLWETSKNVQFLHTTDNVDNRGIRNTVEHSYSWIGNRLEKYTRKKLSVIVIQLISVVIMWNGNINLNHNLFRHGMLMELGYNLYDSAYRIFIKTGIKSILFKQCSKCNFGHFVMLLHHTCVIFVLVINYYLYTNNDFQNSILCSCSTTPLYEMVDIIVKIIEMRIQIMTANIDNKFKFKDFNAKNKAKKQIQMLQTGKCILFGINVIIIYSYSRIIVRSYYVYQYFYSNDVWFNQTQERNFIIAIVLLWNLLFSIFNAISFYTQIKMLYVMIRR